jgi:hypothetical protein
MATQIDNSFRSFSFAGAVSANTLVAITGDNAAAAVVTASESIGVLQEDVSAAGVGSVKLFHPTQFGIVSPGPVTAGLNVFATTGGVLVGSLLTSGITLGVAIQNGATGDVIEYAPKL